MPNFLEARRTGTTGVVSLNGVAIKEFGNLPKRGPFTDRHLLAAVNKWLVECDWRVVGAWNSIEDSHTCVVEKVKV